MYILRSIIFTPLFLISNLLVPALGLPFLLSKKYVRYYVRFWSFVTISLAKYIAGIDYKIEEREKLPKNGGYVVACKHESAWETLVMHLLFDKAAYCYKKELGYIPIWGWFLPASENISIDRKAGASALKKLIKQAKDRAARGFKIIIFPEGTRVKHGTIGEIQSGVYALYKAGIDVYPVALNSGKFWARGSFFKHAGTIKIIYNDKIPEGLSKEEFNEMLKRGISKAQG
jgi:1-acyl-sn-glycerol-3-phosphate acyltransferase